MSAKRFGGQFSPGGDPNPSGGSSSKPVNQFRGRKAASVDVRSLLLFVLPTPILLAAFNAMGDGAPLRLVFLLVAYAALMLGAWLVREGQKAHAAYDARDIAKPPAFPRKLVAAIVTGLGVAGAAAFGAGFGAALGGVLGAIAAACHIAAFGLDPMRAKGVGVGGIAEAELSRVAEKLDEAEAVVAATIAAARGLRDRGLTDRIDRLAYAARDILKDIQSDPRDLRRARRFLSVHLVGLRDATQKFAAARAKGADELRPEYEGLLTDLEASFAKQRERLMVEDQTELEVEIDVLRDRLRQEGAL